MGGASLGVAATPEVGAVSSAAPAEAQVASGLAVAMATDAIANGAAAMACTTVPTEPALAGSEVPIAKESPVKTTPSIGASAEPTPTALDNSRDGAVFTVVSPDHTAEAAAEASVSEIATPVGSIQSNHEGSMTAVAAAATSACPEVSDVGMASHSKDPLAEDNGPSLYPR